MNKIVFMDVMFCASVFVVLRGYFERSVIIDDRRYLWRREVQTLLNMNAWLFVDVFRCSPYDCGAEFYTWYRKGLLHFIKPMVEGPCK